MAQAGEVFRFGAEPPHRIAEHQFAGAQHLDRDVAVERALVGAVDDAHATAAEFAAQLVVGGQLRGRQLGVAFAELLPPPTSDQRRVLGS